MRFGLVSSFDGISNFMGYSMSKPCVLKNNCDTIEIIAEVIREVVLIILPKGNVNARLKFELTYFEVAVKRFINNTPGTLLF